MSFLSKINAQHDKNQSEMIEGHSDTFTQGATYARQLQSPLFQIPLELRQSIYSHIWDVAGRAIHIQHYFGDIDGKEKHVRSMACCLADNFGPDDRRPQFYNLSRDQYGIFKLSFMRFQHGWQNHWRCRQKYRAAGCAVDIGVPLEKWPLGLLPLLLCCHRM